MDDTFCLDYCLACSKLLQPNSNELQSLYCSQECFSSDRAAIVVFPTPIPSSSSHRRRSRSASRQTQTPHPNHSSSSTPTRTLPPSSQFPLKTKWRGNDSRGIKSWAKSVHRTADSHSDSDSEDNISLASASSSGGRPQFPLSVTTPAAPTLSVSPSSYNASSSSSASDPFEAFPSPNMRSWLLPTLQSPKSQPTSPNPYPSSNQKRTTPTRPRKGIFIHPDDLDLDLDLSDEEDLSRGRIQQNHGIGRRGRSPAGVARR